MLHAKDGQEGFAESDFHDWTLWQGPRLTNVFCGYRIVAHVARASVSATSSTNCTSRIKKESGKEITCLHEGRDRGSKVALGTRAINGASNEDKGQGMGEKVAKEGDEQMNRMQKYERGSEVMERNGERITTVRAEEEGREGVG